MKSTVYNFSLLRPMNHQEGLLLFYTIKYSQSLEQNMLKKKKSGSWVWWHRLAIPALEGWGRGCCKLQTSLSKIMSSRLAWATNQAPVPPTQTNKQKNCWQKRVRNPAYLHCKAGTQAPPALPVSQAFTLTSADQWSRIDGLQTATMLTFQNLKSEDSAPVPA